MKGYAQHDPTSPRLDLDGVTWLPMQTIPLGDPKYFAWVSQVAKERAALLPWTLVSMQGEVLVAVKRNLWWRIVTWWHNRERRQIRARVAAESARLTRDLQARLLAGKPLKDGTET